MTDTGKTGHTDVSLFNTKFGEKLVELGFTERFIDEYTALKMKKRALELTVAELAASLRELIGFGMPPDDAPCHFGICNQDECSRCKRIARALAVLQSAEAPPESVGETTR